MAWLIEHHLDMSTIAQSRDLSDRKTVTDFAQTVQSLERLKLLLILTVADIRAVGPGVFNGWKGQLLRTLYYASEPHLSGGHSKMSHKQAIETAKTDLTAKLDHWSKKDRTAYLKRPLSSLLAPYRAGPAAGSCRTPASGRQTGQELVAPGGATGIRGGDRVDDHGSRPSAVFVHHRRRLLFHGRQYRRCANRHDHRRLCAGHDLYRPRIARR